MAGLSSSLSGGTTSAEEVSEMVKKMAEHKDEMTPREQEHLAEMAQELDPELTKAQAETVTEILVKVSHHSITSAKWIGLIERLDWWMGGWIDRIS